MKGISLVTVFGAVIFFISSFFAFFVFDELINTDLMCIIERGAECLAKITNGLVFGLSVLFLMLVMISAAAYIMVKNMSPRNL